MDIETCTAFEGTRRIAAGTLADVAAAVKPRVDAADAAGPVLIFDDVSGRPVDVDFRGSVADLRARLQPVPAEPKGPGRPKLGVVAREVTLLPRHWDWLAAQPGGASVALRKLVEEARRAGEGPQRIRQGREAVYRFMSAMAGDLPGYEEAIRALFAGDEHAFEARIAGFPDDVRGHIGTMAERAFDR